MKMARMCLVMAKPFLSPAQIGRALSFGNNGFNLECSAFQMVRIVSSLISILDLISLSDTVESPPPVRRGRSGRAATRIPISIDADGCPELPTITAQEKPPAKPLQSMLRDYCIAHMREQSFSTS